MSFLLSLLAAKGLGALLGSLLLVAQRSPGFTPPQIRVEGDTISVETSLRHGFNKHLDRLLESGSLIAVAYTATLLVRDKTGQVFEARPVEFFHSAVYDPVRKEFKVYRSELASSADSLTTAGTIRQAKELLSTVKAPILDRVGLPEAGSCSVRIEAALNTIRLEGINDQELDLNVFWNYRYPRAVSAWAPLPNP